MPKGNPNAGDKKVNGILKVYDPIAKAYRPSYIAPDATATVQGDVLLSDSVTSTDNAATGITAATPKAVKEVNDNANTKLSMTATTEQTVAGPVVFGDSLTVEGESTFNEKVTFDKGISIPGGVTLEGNVTGNADTATKLKTAVNINTKSGAQTASTQVSFDGSKDITLPLGDIDASAIKGVLSLDNIPQSAIERVVNYESLDAAFNDYLAAADDNKPFQSGDTIRVPDAEGDTAEMYAIVGDPAVKNNYVKYAASIAAEAVEAEHAQVADKINIADIADGSAMCVIDKVLKKSGATVGGEYKPIYLHNGTFEETTFTIKTNVPADAKFTDTTYTEFTPAIEVEDGTIERGQEGLVPAPTTKDAKFLKNDGTWADVPSNWDELADKPLSYNGTIQDVGIENGKFYVEALFTSIGQVEFEVQLQVLSTAGNQLKLTSATYEPTTDGTAAHKFIIEPPTGQVVADMKIISAGLYYNSTILLDEWKPEQIQSKYPGASGFITVVENQEKVTATGQAQNYTVHATISGNDTQIFKVGVIVSGTEYLSDPIAPTKEGLSYLTFNVAQPPNEGTQGDKVTQVILYCGADNVSYILDRWYPQTQVETLYLNNGKIVKVVDAFNDSTKYNVDYVINTNYDYTKYHLYAWYDIPDRNNGGMSSPEFIVYDVRAGSKNILNGSVLIPKTKTQDSGHGTLELVSIELREQATNGNDIVLDIWEPEIAADNNLLVSIGQIKDITHSLGGDTIGATISITPNTTKGHYFKLELKDDSGHHFLNWESPLLSGFDCFKYDLNFTKQQIEDAGFNKDGRYIKASLYQFDKKNDTGALVSLIEIDTFKFIWEDNTLTAEIIDVKTIPAGTNGVPTGTVRYEVELTVTTGSERVHGFYVSGITKNNKNISFSTNDIELKRGKTVKYTLTQNELVATPEGSELVKVEVWTTAWNGETGAEPTIAVWEKSSIASWNTLEDKPRVCVAVDEASNKWLNESAENEWSLGLNTDLFEVGAPATVNYVYSNLNPRTMNFTSLATSMLVTSFKTQLESFIRQAWGEPDGTATSFTHLTLPTGNMYNKIIELKPNTRYVLTNATTLTNGNGALFAIMTDGNYGKTTITEVGTVQGSLHIYKGIKAEGSKTAKDAVLTTDSVARNVASAGKNGIYIDDTGKMKASVNTEVVIDDKTIIEDYETKKLKVNLLGNITNPISYLRSTDHGIGLRYNNLYFNTIEDSSENSEWDNSYMLNLRVDNKTLQATNDLPLQVWTRPIMYGGSGLMSASTWTNPDTAQEETVDGLYVNPGLGLMINQENEIVLNPQNTPYVTMHDLNWGDTPNGRGINYTVEGLIPRVHEEDSGNFGLGVAVVITQPGNADYKWTKFYVGNFDETDHCYHVNVPAVASGFVGLDSNGGNNAWFSGTYDSNKPINIEIFAADIDDSNQGTFIAFNGLNKQYLNISDPNKTPKTPSYFTASYDCYAVEDKIATSQQIVFKTIGWLETNIVEEEPISLKVFNIDGKVLTTPITIKSYNYSDRTTNGSVRSVFGTPGQSNEIGDGVLTIGEADLTANSITSAPSEYILVVATDKNNKELWAQKIDMPLTYLDPADAAQLVQDALATTTS